MLGNITIKETDIRCTYDLAPYLTTRSFCYIQKVYELLVTIPFVTLGYIIHYRSSCGTYLLYKPIITFEWFLIRYRINILT